MSFAFAPGSESTSKSSSALRLLDRDLEAALFGVLLPLVPRSLPEGEQDFLLLESARGRDMLPPKSLCVASSSSVSELHQGHSWFRDSQPSSRNRSEQLERFVSGLQGFTSVYHRCEQGCVVTFRFAMHMVAVKC